MVQALHGLHEFLLQLLQARSPQAALGLVSVLLVCPLLVLLVVCRFGTPSTATGTARAREEPLSRLPSPRKRLPVIGHLHLIGSLPHISTYPSATSPPSSAVTASSSSALAPSRRSSCRHRARRRPCCARTTTSSRPRPIPPSPTSSSTAPRTSPSPPTASTGARSRRIEDRHHAPPHQQEGPLLPPCPRARGMACPFCPMPSGPCSSFDSSADVFTVVLDRRCSRHVYVPCSVRAHLARYIEQCRVLAIRKGDKYPELALHSSEGELYGVMFSHGQVSRKFHGSSWEQLVADYGLRHRDIMTVRLEHYGTLIGVDFYRDGDMLFLLPCVALEGLSESEKDLVGSCFYTRGVDLNYHQLYFTSRQLFDDNYILCCPFVHRSTSMNVNGHHMVIPSMVVRSLKEFVSVPSSGILTLEITLEYHDDDIYVSIPCSYFIGLGGRMAFKKEGFSDFLQASSIEVNNLVLITFKERDGGLAVIFSFLPQ